MKYSDIYEKFNSLLLSFLVAYDDSVVSDEETIINFLKHSDMHDVEKVLQEGKKVLCLPSFPLRWIQENTNIHFNSEDEARNWVVNILKNLKYEAMKAGKIKPERTIAK